jgi:hypothetical protein
MQPLKQHQVWRTRASENARWRPVEVVSVSAEEIKLQYLDMPDASEAERTVTTTPDHVKNSEQLYIFAGDRRQMMR